MLDRLRRKVVQQVNSRFFLNERLQPLVWSLYYQRSLTKPSVPLPAGWDAHLHTFRRDGVVAIPDAFPEVADHVDRAYVANLETPERAPHPMQVFKIGRGRDEAANTVNAMVSFCDPAIAPLLFGEGPVGLVYDAYGRQPYYREYPRLVVNRPTDGVRPEDEYSAYWHVDCYRQVSFMLLLGDVTKRDTRLQYAKGTHHHRDWPWDQLAHDPARIESSYEIFEGTGTKGTLIVFESGCGLHRAKFEPGSTRKSLQTVITAGHYWTTDPPLDPSPPDLSGKPAHVRRMIGKVLG